MIQLSSPNYFIVNGGDVVTVVGTHGTSPCNPVVRSIETGKQYVVYSV